MGPSSRDVSTSKEPDIQSTHANDELFEFELLNQKPNATHNVPPVRMVNLILDHMAFVHGLGNLKRWFNKEYVDKNLKGKEKVMLNIFIPAYTLHEFDFIKRGTSMRATTVRQAILFLDKCFETEEMKALDEELDESKEPIMYHISLEQGRECGPPFQECLKYKLYSPKIGDFPNFKTKFDNNLLGSNASANAEDGYDIPQIAGKSHGVKTNDIQYENSVSYQNAVSNADKLAEMPTRLKYLIRATIYKTFYEKNNFRTSLEKWKLVTEDPITKIWAKSFGVDCLNVNEAELLLFQNHDVNSHSLYQPQLSFSLDNDEFDISKEILQNTIDTSKYKYIKLEVAAKTKAIAGKTVTLRKQKVSQQGIVAEEVGANGEVVKKERFDSINFAPRGHGQLWRPEPKKRTKK